MINLLASIRSRSFTRYARGGIGDGVNGRTLGASSLRAGRRLWDVSIRNALDEIVTRNKRRKAGGWYLSVEELAEALRGAYDAALDWAALEAFGGAYTAEQLRSMHMTRRPFARRLYG
jgi:hypothetical protein